MVTSRMCFATNCCCGSHEFADLAAYRRFVDEVVGRRNARNRRRIEIERTTLKPLPERRTTDYEEARVQVTSIERVVHILPSPRDVRRRRNR